MCVIRKLMVSEQKKWTVIPFELKMRHTENRSTFKNPICSICSLSTTGIEH